MVENGGFFSMKLPYPDDLTAPQLTLFLLSLEEILISVLVNPKHDSSTNYFRPIIVVERVTGGGLPEASQTGMRSKRRMIGMEGLRCS